MPAICFAKSTKVVQAERERCPVRVCIGKKDVVTDASMGSGNTLHIRDAARCDGVFIPTRLFTEQIARNCQTSLDANYLKDNDWTRHTKLSFNSTVRSAWCRSEARCSL